MLRIGPGAACGVRGALVGSWMFALLTCAFPAAAAEPEPAVHPWRVVLIRNWDALYRINAVRERGLQEALLEGADRPIEVYPEQVDSLRFGTDFDPQFAQLLQRKYRDIPIDLIVVSGMEPLQFAERYRDAIWPGVAIVFHGVVDGWLEQWKRPPRTTGITMTLDVEGTIAAGLALRPSARRLYLIAGTADFDRRYLEQAKGAVARFSDRLEPRYIVGTSRAETLARAREADSDSLLLYLTVLRDGDGRFSGPFNSLTEKIAQQSRAPLLSAVQTQWGRGPVGGSSSNFEEHGRAAGRLARRVLEGADPDQIEVTATPAASCEVDWKALTQWSIPERNVPASCAVVGRPPQLWRLYFWPLVGLVLVILLQAVLLSSLVMQRRRRRVAEHQVLIRNGELARVARISMMGELTASIAHEINQPMGAILSNTEAAQMMLDQNKLEPGKLREILADIRSEDLRASEVIRGLRKMLAQREWNLAYLELNTEVAEALRHVAFDAARRGVRLVPTFASDVPSVYADGVQLQQVVINLVMNAMDEVGEQHDGQRDVWIETRTAKDGVEIVVADRGPGVPPENREKLFQSMFTTKKDGMGFGLSIVKTIVEMHQGTVRFEPNLPRGALFRVWLPAVAT